MSISTSSKLSQTLLFIAACGFSVGAASDTRSYAATTDFPVTDAGEVPYYSEAPGRPSLAINAAIEEFRERYARATVVYDGNEGVHDITIVALAELDGEAEYRLLINDEVVGTATNPEVTRDYTVVRHVFEDITVPVGAVLGVESLANTNGKIPEGDGTAFARGRWTTLELLEDTGEEEPVVITPSEIDLALSISADNTTIAPNENFAITVTLSNAANSMTATQPVVSLALPLQALTVISAEQCIENTLGFTCLFSEIPAGESQSMDLSFTSGEDVIQLNVQATAEADQTDRDGTNNVSSLSIGVVDPDIGPEPTPDEQLTPVPVDNNQPEVTMSSSGSSGGGAISLLMALMMISASLGRMNRR